MSTRDDWFQQRRAGIGGSDIAAILGLSKWRTPLDVYLDKRGEAAPQPDNDSMRWGRYLEPAVRQAYADETGAVVRLPTEMLRHPRHEWAIANLDGVTDEPRVFEAKTARTADGWGEAGSDQIPQPYLLQVQWYMEIAAVPVTDVAALFGGSDFRIYTVPADRELQEMLLDAAAEFWRQVQRGEPPEPVSYADTIARWGRSSHSDKVQADENVMSAVAQLRDLKTKREHMDLAEEEWRTVIFQAMADCDTLVDSSGKTIATWKVSAGAKRFDSAAFKVAHPALYDQFVKQGQPTRRWLLK